MKVFALNFKGVEYKKYLFGILIAGLSVRMLVSIFLFVPPATSDSFLYHRLAISTLSHGDLLLEGIPYHANPLYPMFVASIYKLLGVHPQAVAIIQSIIDTFTILLVFLMINEVIASNKIALMGSFFYSIYVPMIELQRNLMTEVITIFLLVASVYLFLLAIRKNKAFHCLLSSFLLALVALTRQNFIFIILVFLLFLIAKRKIKFAVLFFLIYLFTFAPYLINNYKNYGTCFPKVGGAVLYIGNYFPTWGGSASPLSFKDYVFTKEDAIFYSQYLKITSIIKREFGTEFVRTSQSDSIWFDAAISNIKKRPLKAILLSLMKVSRMYFNFPFREPKKGGIHIPSMAAFVIIINNIILILFSLFGLKKLYKKNEFAFYLILSILFYATAIHAISASVVRYSYPLIPFIIVFSSIGLKEIYHIAVKRAKARPS